VCVCLSVYPHKKLKKSTDQKLT